MADFDSSLPIRTQNAGDAIVKIADATLPAQQLKVEADGSINVNAAFSPGTEVKITDGTDDLAVNADGSINVVATATNLDIRDLVFATDKVDVSGSSVTVTATDLDIRDLNSATDSVTVVATNLDIRDLNSATDSVTVVATNLDIRDLAFATDKVDVSGSSVTVSATDLDIRDLSSATDSVTVVATNLDIRDLSHTADSVKVGDGTDFLAVNADGSINVRVSNSTPGTSINDYNTVASVAAGASSTHTYTSTGNFYLEQIEASGSGKLKIEVQVNGATRFVQFNSTSSPNMSITLQQPILATTGQTVTVIRTNRDNQAQDVYSTIAGYIA
jgi:hypothetical protein